MNKIKIKNFIDTVTKHIAENITNKIIVSEGNGFDAIFEELKKKLDKISMLPDNVIDASQYKAHEIVQSIKSLGYEYKRPINNKLHFFNKKSSISLYLKKNDLTISLLP